MFYIENIYICLGVPIIVAIFFLKGRDRRFCAFLLLGMTMSLMSAYCNSFLSAVFNVATDEALVKVTPICEEAFKLLPLVLYVLLANPERKYIPYSAIGLGVGFATFENCCYMVQYGSANLGFMMIRGLAVGTMHTVTAVILGYCLYYVLNQKTYQATSFIFGIWCITATYHSVYNLLVYAKGTAEIVGYLMPTITIIIMIILKYKIRKN